MLRDAWMDHFRQISFSGARKAGVWLNCKLFCTCCGVDLLRIVTLFYDKCTFLKTLNLVPMIECQHGTPELRGGSIVGNIYQLSDTLQ